MDLLSFVTKESTGRAGDLTTLRRKNSARGGRLPSVIKRWHHGHSLGAGLLAGLALATYRVWLLLAAAFLLGVVATLLVPRLVRLGASLGALFTRWQPGR